MSLVFIDYLGRFQFGHMAPDTWAKVRQGFNGCCFLLVQNMLAVRQEHIWIVVPHEIGDHSHIHPASYLVHVAFEGRSAIRSGPEDFETGLTGCEGQDATGALDAGVRAEGCGCGHAVPGFRPESARPLRDRG